MIRPTKKLHLRTESIRVLTPTALRTVQGGVMGIEKCTKDYSGCNPVTTATAVCGTTKDCGETYTCDTTGK
jgi:hypothetical protein